MVKVLSSQNRSTEKFVQVEIHGIREVQDKLRRIGIEISNQTELKLVQTGNLLQQEVQESIIGNRVEQKSVDTGNFANSIEVEANELKSKKIKVKTDVAYAKYLEYGTSFIIPRMHFRNSLARNTPIIRKLLGEGVKIAVNVAK